MPSDTNMIVLGIASLALRSPHSQVPAQPRCCSSSGSPFVQDLAASAVVGSDVIWLWCSMMLCRFQLTQALKHVRLMKLRGSHIAFSVGNVLFQWKYPKVGSAGGAGFWLHILLMSALAAAHFGMQRK